MKALLFLIAFLPFVAKAQSKLEITHLTGGFYVYTTYHDLGGSLFPANGMYVLTSEGAVVFDTPWDTTQFQPLLDSIRIKHNATVKLCISTHSHEDRTAGLTYYRSKGIRTYTSKMTDSICKLRGNPRAEFTFEKDTLFKLGQHKFKMLYPGPGHTSDNIIGWFPKEKIVYGGCLIKSTEAADLGNLGDANVRAWPQTMRTLKKSCPSRKFVIPGHQSWADKRSVEYTEKLVEEYLKKQRR